MTTTGKICWTSISVLLLSSLPVSQAGEKPRTMRAATILTTSRESYLVYTGGTLRFRKGDLETTWNLQFSDEGLTITLGRRSEKPWLGVDPKTKQLALFDKPGTNTTWQLKPAGAYEIMPPKPFKALLYMNVGDDEMRLSADERGLPVMGGKADILHFMREGP